MNTDFLKTWETKNLILLRDGYAKAYNALFHEGERLIAANNADTSDLDLCLHHEAALRLKIDMIENIVADRGHGMPSREEP